MAWAESLGGIHYPLLSDFWPHGRVCEQYGVFRPDGFSERALFLVDKEGFLRYGEIVDIDIVPDNNALRDEIRRIDRIAAAREPRELREPGAPLPRGGVVMYCTRWCSDCKRARVWLAEHGIQYTEVDIYETGGAEEQVRRWCNGNLITPTFDINGTVVVDFNENRLRQVLGL